MNLARTDWRARGGTRVHIEHETRRTVTWFYVPTPCRKMTDTVRRFRRLHRMVAG